MHVTALCRSLREVKASGQAVCLLTLKGDFTLSGSMTEDMYELITVFLSGLTERSQYAVALKDVDRQGQRTGGQHRWAFLTLSQLTGASADQVVSCVLLQMIPCSSASRKENS